LVVAVEIKFIGDEGGLEPSCGNIWSKRYFGVRTPENAANGFRSIARLVQRFALSTLRFKGTEVQ
jgi:hypothetical protein